MSLSVSRKPVAAPRGQSPTIDAGKEYRASRLKAAKAGLSFLSFTLLSYYLYRFARSLSKHWFNPLVTNDDVQQQSFMFHEIRYPGVFDGDLITQAMSTYLAPAHYALMYALTWLSSGPVMAAHWNMLLQLLPACFGLYFLVRKLSGVMPACFAVAWFVHSRELIERMSGGLPRGWAASVLILTLCFSVYSNHLAVLIVLFFGCLSNPPSTMIAALFYGLLLLWRYFFGAPGDEPALHRKRLIQYIALSPAYLLITLYVCTPPAFLGSMASYEDALANPAFARDGGRFGFIPFLSISREVLNEGFFAFISNYERIDPAVLEQIPYLVCIAIAGIAALALLSGRKVLPLEPALFICAAAMVYLASRQIPFHLYVPDRHIRTPMGIFFITAFPIALWRLAMGVSEKTEIRQWAGSLCIALLLFSGLAALIYRGSASGLHGHAQFIIRADDTGRLFPWLFEHTEQDALIAGHPFHINGTMLFAVRKAYITSETAHPFYDRYYAEAERRLRVSWQAYYSTSLREFYELLSAEGIDYFVFRRNDFRTSTLAKAYYYQPLTAWVQQLASKDPEQYAFKKLPWGKPHADNPILPFRDARSIVVDVNKLGTYLNTSS